MLGTLLLLLVHFHSRTAWRGSQRLKLGPTNSSNVCVIRYMRLSSCMVYRGESACSYKLINTAQVTLQVACVMYRVQQDTFTFQTK